MLGTTYSAQHPADPSVRGTQWSHRCKLYLCIYNGKGVQYRCNSSGDGLATRLELATRQQWWPTVHSVEIFSKPPRCWRVWQTNTTYISFLGRKGYRMRRSRRLHRPVLQRHIVGDGDKNRIVRWSATCSLLGAEAGGVPGRGHKKRRFLRNTIVLGTFTW